MKTLIVYKSKRGFTKKCAEYINNNIDSDISNDPIMADLKAYEHIIIASPVYMGKINKDVNTLITEQLEILMTKKVSLVICGMNNKELETMKNTNFTKEFLDHASFFYPGGAYYFDKLNFLERLIVKKITGIKETTETIKYDVLQSVK